MGCEVSLRWAPTFRVGHADAQCGIMTFRVTGRVRMPQGETVTAARRVIGPSREMCGACEWFQSSVSRCCHPRNGCPRGGHRIRPWEHPQECPVSRRA